MPLDLAALKKTKRTVKFKFNKSPVSVTYNLALITKDFYDRVAKRTEDGEREYTSYQYLADVIEDWDITEDGAKVVPTAELLESLPTAFVQALDQAIFEDATPKVLTR